MRGAGEGDDGGRGDDENDGDGGYDGDGVRSRWRLFGGDYLRMVSEVGGDYLVEII